MDTRSKLTAALLIGTLAVLSAWFSAWAGWLDTPENYTLDVRQRRLSEPVRPSVPIRMILVDEQSLEWARAMSLPEVWPWPYEMYTPIIKFCRQSGAKAVAFDVLFTEPSRYGVPDDTKLAETIAAVPDTVLFVKPGAQSSSVSSWPEGVGRPTLRVNGLDRYLTTTGAEGLVAERCVFPFKSLAGSGAMFGHITPVAIDPLKDIKPIVREARPFIRFDQTDLPAMGLAMYLIGLDEPVSEAWIEGSELHVGDTVVPLGDDGMAKLRYRQPSKANNGHLYKSYSAAAVIQSQLRVAAGEEPTIDPAEFKDCYVFFGLSASGLYDLLPTPVTPLSPGVMVHATFLDNLLHDAFFLDVSWYWVVLFALVVAIAGAWGVQWVSGWVKVLPVYLVVLPVPVLAGLIGTSAGYAWPIAWPMVSAGSALVGATIFSLATEGKQKRFIRRAFGHYLSPAVIDRVLDDPSLLRLGGERREVTVMFIDLQGFTSTAEKLEPDVLSELLNHYLTAMSEAILDEDGTLDKYQGDAVMAFWNAPLDQPDHALRACRAALGCKEKLVGLRRHWFDVTGGEPRMRIGIHTGTCVVGNMGSRQRFDYTVLGDTANLASRLEGVNKVFGTTVLASEQTWDQVEGKLAGRGIARVSVVGRNEPVVVVEPFATDPNRTHATGETFDKALMLCERGEFVDAMHLFEQLDHDPVSRAYADRLAAIMRDPHPAWDCIWDLKSK